MSSLPATGGASNSANWTGAAVKAPYWVRITRTGNTFTCETSPDGKTWAQLGTAQTITMTNPVLIGLALCSHDAAIATGAVFSNVSTTSTVTGAWQNLSIGVTQLANDPAPLYLAVEDKAGKKKTALEGERLEIAELSPGGWGLKMDESFRRCFDAGYNRVVFIGSRTGMMVKRPAVGAEGFVLDHYGRGPVDRYLDADVIGALLVLGEAGDDGIVPIAETLGRRHPQRPIVQHRVGFVDGRGRVVDDVHGDGGRQAADVAGNPGNRPSPRRQLQHGDLAVDLGRDAVHFLLELIGILDHIFHRQCLVGK